MNKSLRDFLVVSDIDGTLLRAANGLPSCNATVVRLFTQLGGRFTVATGRSPLSVKNALKGLPLNAPAVLFNGGLLYDYEKGQVLNAHLLPREMAAAAVRELLSVAPGVGVEILADNGRLYQPACSEQGSRHMVHEKLPYIHCPLQEVPGEWYKVLFAAPPAVIDQLKQYVEENRWEGGYFAATAPTYLELLPAGVDKGSGLRELCRYTGTDPQQVIAIGDYYNDLELLRAAGHPVAVGNAVPDVKLICEGEVLPCNDGGVAQLLYELIRRYGG